MFWVCCTVYSQSEGPGFNSQSGWGPCFLHLCADFLQILFKTCTFRTIGGSRLLLCVSVCVSRVCMHQQTNEWMDFLNILHIKSATSSLPTNMFSQTRPLKLNTSDFIWCVCVCWAHMALDPVPTHTSTHRLTGLSQLNAQKQSWWDTHPRTRWVVRHALSN